MNRLKLKDILQIRDEYSGDILVHVSDTPLISLLYIKKIVKKLNAKYVIHTGDFIDELKTTHPLFDEKDYERAISKFMNKLKGLSIDDIYLVPGNHDNPTLLEKYKDDFKIIREGSVIDIGGVSFSVAHDYNNLKVISGKRGRVYYLYGHNRYRDEREQYLNGYCSINIIFIDSFKVYSIPYPFFVNIVRGKNHPIKIGL